MKTISLEISFGSETSSSNDTSCRWGENNDYNEFLLQLILLVRVFCSKTMICLCLSYSAQLIKGFKYLLNLKRETTGGLCNRLITWNVCVSLWVRFLRLFH